MMTPMLASTENALALGKIIVLAVVRRMDELATAHRLRRDYDLLSKLDNKRLAELGLTAGLRLDRFDTRVDLPTAKGGAKLRLNPRIGVSTVLKHQLPGR